MRKYTKVTSDVIVKNSERVGKILHANGTDNEYDACSVMLVGKRVDQFLKIFGNDGVQQVLDFVQDDLDALPLYGELHVSGDILGTKFHINFVKEAQETASELAEYRVFLYFG